MSEGREGERVELTYRIEDLLACLDYVTDALSEALRCDWEYGDNKPERDAIRANADEAVDRGFEMLEPWQEALRAKKREWMDRGATPGTSPEPVSVAALSQPTEPQDTPRQPLGVCERCGNTAPNGCTCEPQDTQREAER